MERKDEKEGEGDSGGMESSSRRMKDLLERFDLSDFDTDTLFFRISGVIGVPDAVRSSLLVLLI